MSLLDRIVRESGVDDLLDVLSERLTPTDLQSVLLEVYRRRAAGRTAAEVLARYVDDRFVRPSPLRPDRLVEFDRLAFRRLSQAFEPVELSPVAPLGVCSALAPIDQNFAVSTVRNTEVVSDPTNVLALECAVRRRALLGRDPRSAARVRLCTSHRTVRTQRVDRPGFFAHFRLFALVTAGRDEGSYRFETESAPEHIAMHLLMLDAARQIDLQLFDLRVHVANLEGDRFAAAIEREIVDPLAARFPAVEFQVGPRPADARDYYQGLRFTILARDAAGVEHHLSDGGFTPWTQALLSSGKERLLVSGIGTERLCSVFAP
jgi:hypothetical protein